MKAARRERVVKRLSGHENKRLNDCDDQGHVEKKKTLWRASTRAPTLKRTRFVKNGYRFMAVTNISADFNKLSTFAF